MSENVSGPLLDQLLTASREKDRATLVANVAMAEVNLADAKMKAMHAFIVDQFDLKSGDTYDANGVITRASTE